MAKQRRKLLGRFGTHGATVNVYSEPSLDVIRVYRYVKRRRVSRSWPNTPLGKAQALAWAQGLSNHREQALNPAKHIEQLWTAYKASPDWATLAEATRTNYTTCWERFAQYFPRVHPEAVDFGTFDALRKHLEARGLTRSVQRHTISAVKMIFRWATGRRLVITNHIEAYRFQAVPGEEESPGEYSGVEWRRLLETLNPMSGFEWRPFVALTIIGSQGVRSIAALNLAWADIDEAAGIITWRAEFDKNRRTWYAPLRDQTRAALAVARHWQTVGTRRAPPRPSTWVLPGIHPRNKRATYSYSALWWSLKKAERRASIFHEPNRALHGLRRMLAGDVYDETQSIKAAMEAIGDTSIAVMERYLKSRTHRVSDAIRSLDAKLRANQPPAPPPVPPPAGPEDLRGLPPGAEL